MLANSNDWQVSYCIVVKLPEVNSICCLGLFNSYFVITWTPEGLSMQSRVEFLYWSQRIVFIGLSLLFLMESIKTNWNFVCVFVHPIDLSITCHEWLDGLPKLVCRLKWEIETFYWTFITVCVPMRSLVARLPSVIALVDTGETTSEQHRCYSFFNLYSSAQHD